MKGNIVDQTPLTPRVEREILDEIRNDHELIGRLKITPQELEALSKCALLGTLTCKQDMLFILRQIREAGHTDLATRIPQPSLYEDRDEDPVPPPVRRLSLGVDAAALHDAASLDAAPRRRVTERFGVLFWAVILVLGLAWNGVVAVSRWREGFLTGIGTPAGASSEAWFGNVDRFSVLLFWEMLFVVGIAIVVHLKTRRNNRHLKVRPARTWR